MMPIPKDRFEEARKPLEERILHFLKSNNEQAYSVWEIIRACEGYDPSSNYEAMYIFITHEKEYKAALQRLIEQGLISEGKLKGDLYYGTA